MAGCHEKDILPAGPELEVPAYGQEFDATPVNEGPMVLGKQLENPYSVENMKRALESLTSKSNGRIASTDIDISTPTYTLDFFLQTQLKLHCLKLIQPLNFLATRLILR